MLPYIHNHGWHLAYVSMPILLWISSFSVFDVFNQDDNIQLTLFFEWLFFSMQQHDPDN